VQGPNSSDVKVEISYLALTCTGNAVFQDTIAANSRKTYNMSDAIPDDRPAIMITSKTADKEVMVERAMYWTSGGAGTDTIGGYSDQRENNWIQYWGSLNGCSSFIPANELQTKTFCTGRHGTTQDGTNSTVLENR
jgi:hypothetical protein